MFLAPPAADGAAFRQTDGVVTHPARPPYHLTEATLRDLAQAAHWQVSLRPDTLPRGQFLAVLTHFPDPNRSAASRARAERKPGNDIRDHPKYTCDHKSAKFGKIFALRRKIV